MSLLLPIETDIARGPDQKPIRRNLGRAGFVARLDKCGIHTLNPTRQLTTVPSFENAKW